MNEYVQTLLDMKKILVTYMNKLLSLAYIVNMLVVIWFVLQITTFSSFRIPTSSMQPTLQPGDYILVNKWIMGGRVFNIWDAADGKEVPVYRLPGVRKVKRNDVLVFHYPYSHSDDSLSIDLLKYYVKRCIALPGDTMGIRKGHYYIKGWDDPVGNIKAQERMGRLNKEDTKRIVMEAYPWDGYMNWTILDFGPFYIPAKGQTIDLDSTAVKLYKKLVEWEQQKKLVCKGNDVFLDDSLIAKYRFDENYYFVGGDYMENSQDSRYWGVLPESFIVGVATRIWNSVDKSTDKIRWDRVMKKIE